MAGKPAAAAVSGVADLAKESAERNRGMLSSFIDEGLSNHPSGKSEGDAIRAKRELGFALTHLFTSDPSAMAANQQAVVTTLVESQGMSEAEAKKMVDGWSASYQKLKTDLNTAKQALELQARELAEQTAKTLSILSFCSFVAFVLGAIFATMGGKHGGACAYKRTEPDVAIV